MNPLIEIAHLSLDYRLGRERVRALDGVELSIEADATLGVVGESGSGKSTLGLAIGRLLPPNANRVSGDLYVNGRSLFGYSTAELRSYRRERLGFIFQSPAAALDPTRRIGRQLRDLFDNRPDISTEPRKLLAAVGFRNPDEVLKRYPHELSGGMAQRVVIAMAVARRPGLVVADEPTASLDSAIRKQVLDMLFGLPEQIGAALVVLTHDLTAVAARCQQVAVMYAGRVVETGSRSSVLEAPRHPYTAGLLAATPGRESAGAELAAIAGTPPVLRGPSTACAYAPRCPLASAVCREARPEPRQVDGRAVVCHHAEDVGRQATHAPSARVGVS